MASEKKEKEVAFIAVRRKAKGWSLSGNWIDIDGKSFDLGYLILPTGANVRKGIECITDQLEATLKGHGVPSTRRDS